MARPKKDAPVNLDAAQELTAGLIERLTCPSGKTQAFMRDAKAPGLRVRVTVAGAKSYVFEAKLNRQTIRRTIGDVRAWTIDAARTEANRLRVVLDGGADPREIERAAQADADAKRNAAQVAVVTVGSLWPQYLAEGRPKKKEAWKPRYRADLEAMAAPGGIKKVRGQGTTKPGPIFPLLALPLAQVNEDTLKAWHDEEAKAGPHQAARAFMMFRGFLRWASTKPAYRAMTDRDAGRAAAILDTQPSTKASKRKDCLEDAQLQGWFAGCDTLGNRTFATYLKALLMTGSRREEMAALRWEDIDFRWSRLTLADKMTEARIIPLSPYLAHLLAAMQRVNSKDGKPNPYVFAAKSASGHIEEPRSNFKKVNLHAGVTKLTIHGLRRSFSLLGESAGAPAGAIAQIMGHSPDSIAESYRPRSVDALRAYLAQIETHILEQAGVEFVPDASGASSLHVVA